jgi:translocation and assembly module TamA
MRSRLVRRALVAVVSVVGFLLFVVAVAHVGFVRARVLDWVSARISQDFGILVQADALRYNLLTVSVELRNPRLSVPRDRPFLQADAIRIALNRRVLFGVFELERLELEQPRVTIVRHPDGATNLPTSRSDSASSPEPIHLGRVGLRGLIVEVEDESAGHRVAAGPIDLTLDTRAGAASPGTFGPSPLVLRIGPTERQVPARSLSGTFNGRLGFDGSRLTIHDLRLEAPEGRLSLAGWLDVISKSTGVEMRGRLETDLARAGPLFLPPGDPLTGSATLEMVVRGAVANPTVRLEVTGRNLRFRSTPEIGLAASATYAAGRADLDRLAVTSDVGEIEATATLHVTTEDGKPGESRLAGRIARLDLDRALRAAGLSLPVAIGSTAGGNINLSLDAGTPVHLDSWRYVKGDGTIELRPDGSGLSLSGRVDLTARDRRWTVGHALRAAAGRTTLEGTIAAELPDSNLSGTLSGKSQLQIQEIRTLLPVLRQAGVALPAPFDQIDGTLDVQIVPRGALDAPTLNATVNGRRIRLPDVTDEGELGSTITIDRRALTAKSLDARLGDLRVAASGAYMWQGRIETEFKATADDLSAIAAAFDLADTSLAGSTELEGVVRGSIQSPQGRAHLTANGLSAYGVQVGAVTAQLQLGSDRLEIDGTAPALEMHLTGTLGTRSPFRFQAEADFDKSPVSALLSAPQTKHLSGEGSVTATVKANGTLQQIAETAGEIELRTLDVKVSGVPMSLDSRASVAFGPTSITATPLRLRVGRETDVRLEGTLATNVARDGIDVHVQGTLADLLDAAAPAVPDLMVTAENSRVELDLHVGGTLTTPQPAGTLRVEASGIGYRDLPPVSDLNLNARIEPARIALQTFTARWQGANVTAEGELPVRMIVPESPIAATGIASWGSNWLTSLPVEPRSATLTARVTGVTREALAPFIDPGQLQRIGGSVDASITAEADGFSLDAVRGSVVLDQAAIDVAGVPFRQTVPTRIRFDRGKAHIEALRWEAQGNELRASGTADVIGPAPAIDITVDGGLDLRVLGAFATGLASGGVAQTSLTIKGPLSSPELVGNIDVKSGELRLETPSMSATDFSGTITVDASRKGTIALTGLVNGGPTDVRGTLALENLMSPAGRVTLTARNVVLEYPEGFQTESNVDLALTLSLSASTLSGRVDVLSGIYREPLIVSRSLLAGLGSAVATVESQSSFLTNLRLDVTVATTNEIRIDNNYGRVNLSANLLVTGWAAKPGLLGRLEAEPDGEVFLAGNTYRIQTLTVDLTNPQTIAPSVTFLAETRVKNVPIEITLQCPASGPCEREVRSQAAGITNEEAEALLFGISADPNVAGAQLVRLLSGELLGVVGGRIGLDTLRLEQAAGERSDLFDDPTLVAGDVNPASRLTVGKRVGERVELAYSQDLAQNGFVMSTSYYAPAGISLRALLLDNQNRSYEFRHEPRFGARRRPQPPPRATAIVEAIRFTGKYGFAENELHSQLRLTEGDRFDFSTWQDDRERLRRYYQERSYFEARVRARRTADGDAVTLEYDIEQGPPSRLEVSGFELPDEVRRRIIDRWSGAVFDGFLERDVAVLVRGYLYQEGRLGAKVTATIGGDEASRTLRVVIDPGPMTMPRLQVEGNASIATERITKVVESLGPFTAWLDAMATSLAIERLYQQEGLLSAAVDVLAPEIQGDTSVVRVVIREGGPWQIGRVTLGGAEALPGGGSPADLGIAPGSRYNPTVITEGVSGLEQRFRNEGFLDVRVQSETVLDHAAKRADVHVLVAPGPRSTLASVTIEGAGPDDPTIVRSLDMPVGTPINASSIIAARRRLYETGKYRSVEIALEPEAGVEPIEQAAGDRRVVARVRVEERARYSFRYGLSVNSDAVSPDERDTKLAFAADVENRNLFGRGMTVGLSARLRRDQEVARAYLGANRFFGLPLRSNLFLSRSRQDIGSDGTVKTVSDVTEISAEQIYRLRRFIDVRYGYGLGRNRTTIEDPISPFDLTVRVARLTTSGLVDRRNDPFDPVRGWFSSANVELSRPGLGSELNFLRSYLQFYRFIPVRGGLVVASAVRVGMARTFQGETLIPSERFFAGGATSVRGYSENDLGARSIFGDAEGGQALFIGNGELRFPIYRWARGVGFVDFGDVYPTVGDLLRSLQVGTGAGIRLNTPIGLFRLDVGVPVNRRPFDERWTVHFGLGHAF